MIVARLSDGLGNQLFQYACARSLALARDQPLCLDPTFFASRRNRQLGLEHFHLAGRMLQPLGLRRGQRVEYGVKLPRGIRVFVEPRLGYDPQLAEVRDEHVLLCGYFQSERYFRGVADTIRADLRFRELPRDDAALATEQQIAAENAVSVHVRRTDYVGRPLFDVLGPRYFARAIQRCRERLVRPRFFVFSDDLAYCRAELPLVDAVFVEVPAARHPAVDLRLMSLCRHHVIANSSFSWWGAWLDPRPDKLVLAPSVWFNPADALPIDEVLPPEWTRIDP